MNPLVAREACIFSWIEVGERLRGMGVIGVVWDREGEEKLGSAVEGLLWDKLVS